MNKINRGRFTADIDGAFVVFLIGMRINQPWKVHRWLPIFFKMPRMLRELYQDPNSGFLGHVGTLTMIQYWRSYDQLEAYARNRDKSHWPAWVDFQRSVSNSNGEVGIWHETYCVSPSNWETLYANMPDFGLGRASRSVPINRQSARERFRNYV